jgi:hypothetical protein
MITNEPIDRRASARSSPALRGIELSQASPINRNGFAPKD